MNNLRAIGILTATLCVGMAANAMDASAERYAKMLATGGPGTVGHAAEEVYNTGQKDPELLDLAAQVLEEMHLKNVDDSQWADATSWVCKAIGASGNGRYKAFMDQVAASPMSRKARKYCEGAAKQLPAGVADAFAPGSVSVSDYKEGGLAYGPSSSSVSPTRAAVEAAAAPAAPVSSAKKVDFSIVKEGMSMQEVTDLIGQPTSRQTYMTGKQFIPFNFGARDVARMDLRYKGIGRLVLSLRSAYNGVYRVIQVVPDPGESGYP